MVVVVLVVLVLVLVLGVGGPSQGAKSQSACRDPSGWNGPGDHGGMPPGFSR